MCIPNDRIPKYTKEKITELKREIDNSKTLSRHINQKPCMYLNWVLIQINCKYTHTHTHTQCKKIREM